MRTLPTITLTKLLIFYLIFYLISYLISLSMSPIRRSNRAHKPKIYWEPIIKSSCQQCLPVFTIHTDLPEDLAPQLSPALGTQSPEDSSTQLVTLRSITKYI